MRRFFNGGLTWLHRLVSSLRAALRSWYRVDQIRISPCDGRLLQLRVGDSFLLFNRLYEVEQRLVESAESLCRIRLRLVGDNGPASLFVQRSRLSLPVEACLETQVATRPVFETDIVPVSSL